MKLDLSPYDLKDGDELSLKLIVKDAVQEVLSEPIVLHIVENEDQQYVMPFIQKSDAILKLVKKQQNELQSIQNAIDLIEGFTPDEENSDLSERRHQLNIQSLRLKKVDEEFGGDPIHSR